ncbi:hypothetical protein [Staphylococcus xylosus]|uniref:hypothetical protein n=1 Tax=Staphylococcus xylosus TaxID=1288 RepID=UPI003F567B47
MKKLNLKEIVKLKQYKDEVSSKEQIAFNKHPLKSVMTYGRYEELNYPTIEEYKQFLQDWKAHANDQIKIRESKEVTMLSNDMQEEQYRASHECRKVFSFGRWLKEGKPTLEEAIEILEKKIVEVEKIINKN